MIKKIIIIGAGHSGLEAANIASKMCEKVLLITNNINNLGELSCNPSMGGIGKSHLIREIDALGGAVGHMSTFSSMQLKKINFSKGEAVSCVRSQINRKKYKKISRYIIRKNKNITLVQDEVKKILIKNRTIKGVKTSYNTYKANAIILTTGTFLNSLLCIGSKKYKLGRLNEKSSLNLSKQLNSINEDFSRLKTGTPPRLCGKNINFKIMKIQKGDFNPIPTLSYWYRIKNIKKQKNCWLTNTTNKTKEIIKKNLKKSPIYKNIIGGASPRYCPSIEDKIYRFHKIKKHNIFLEPDGFNCFYPNGVSTSLPYLNQVDLIRSIKGLEKSKISRPGYAIEYDFYCPKNLKKSLESKIVRGLFFAGQINGTTGYEEAAAQGIVAGINAALYIKKKKYWYPNKRNSYIGLMLNDIIKRGVTEPYRIFTNKSDNNLNLREDNAVQRLSNVLKNLKLKPLKNFKNNKIVLSFYFKNFIKLNNSINNIFFFRKIKNQLKIYFKYKRYINSKIFHTVKKKIFIKNTKIKKRINYFEVEGLSREVSEKLNKENFFELKDFLKSKLINKNSLNIIINYLKRNNFLK